MPRFAKRADANHKEIMEAFRKLGCSVADLSGAADIEPGCPDIAVAVYGKTCMVEIKTEKGKLRPAQQEFAERWQGMRATVRDVEGVVSLVMAMRMNVEANRLMHYCPNCVTPWKCNGPHLPEMKVSQITTSGHE